ncbi:ABC transporter permease subunit [Clostridium thermarum]|uniref:ABC transporter permease subunit n=1 Tax=Clostridium thermarum TaxID=1716543 RepID=UPI0011239D04|nr:ABC transporter permease subunit [Clostridium thermarum]
MIRLFKIETFKLFKRTKTWVVIIAFILLTALLAYGSYRDTQNAKRYNSPEARLANLEDHLKYLESERDVIPEEYKDDEAKIQEYKSMYEQQINDVKTEMARIKTTIEQRNNSNWREINENRIKELEDQIKDLESLPDKGGSSITYLQEELDQLKYLQQHDIKPMEDYDFNAIKFIIQLVQILGEVFLVIGIAVFAADVVSGEATPPTMKLLLTQPISRAKVLFSKFLSINIASIVCILGAELIAFVVVGLIFGFGETSYPMFVGAQYKFDTTQLVENGTYPLMLIAGSKYIIPAWQYVVKLLLLQALFVIVCTSVVFLISTLVKASMVSMGISVVSSIASLIVFSAFSGLRKFARFVFVMFGNVENILTGRFAERFNNPNVNFSYIMIMFVVWIVGSYIISHVVFTKKDILI